MLESVCLQNYKAFNDVTIPIKPLTILLGANSVGKSSIIQMLMLLHQTAEERRGQYSSALKIYGNYVNIGAIENLYKGKDISQPLLLKLNITSSETVELLRECKDDYIERFLSMAGLFPMSEMRTIDPDQIKNRDEFQQFVNKLLKTLKERNVGEDKHFVTYMNRRYGLPLDMIDEENIGELMRGYDIREKLSQKRSSEFFLTFVLIVKKGKLRVNRFSVELDNGVILLDVESKTEKNVKVVSDFNLNGRDFEYIIDRINFDNTIFNIVSERQKSEKSAMTAAFLLDICDNLITDLAYDLSENRLNYVSPLRAHPKRYYMLDKAKMTFSLDTLDGDAIAEVMKDNRSVKKSVNEWFAKFGFKIDVQEFKEVIHHVNVTQNGLPLDITDVGFGISQVLPIIIQGFLSEQDTLTIIEQPEIHLHPKMQADLGDLFIDIVKNNNKRLMIETHSEYILRRIRRRISEGKISSKDVSICLFHPKSKNNSAWVEQLEIGEKGNFKWPEEYYCGDLYDDIMVYLQNQNNGNNNDIPIPD